MGQAGPQYVKYLVLFEGAATAKMEVALAAAGNKVLRGSGQVHASGRENGSDTGQAPRRYSALARLRQLRSAFINEFDRGDQFVAEVKKLR